MQKKSVFICTFFRKVGGSAASDGVVTETAGRYVTSAFSRDQATRKSDRLPVTSSAMPADLDSRYTVLQVMLFVMKNEVWLLLL